jgi:hypothetical protein
MFEGGLGDPSNGACVKFGVLLLAWRRTYVHITVRVAFTSKFSSMKPAAAC